MSEDDHAWPLEERLLGIAVRGGLLTVALTPAALALPEPRVALPLAGGLALGFAWAERRAAPPGAGLGRLALAGAVLGLVAPMAWVWLRHLGDPEAGYAALARGLVPAGLKPWQVLLAGGAGATIALGSLGPLLEVRRRTALVGPQLLTIALPSLGVGVVSGACAWLRGDPDLVTALAWPLTGVLAGLLLWLGDLVTARCDPCCPGPPRERATGLVPWLLGLVLAVGLGLAAFVPTLYGHHRCNHAESHAIGALKTIVTSQAVFAQGDREGDGLFDHAASLQELADEMLVDSVLGSGTKGGYLFRVIRSEAAPDSLWCGAADPLRTGPGRTLRHFFVDRSGAVFYTSSTPPGGLLALDPETCGPPAGMVRVGR